MTKIKQTREQRLKEISNCIGRRRLVYFGTRGADARALLEFKQFGHCICLIAPLSALSVNNECCLESITGSRVDLNSYHTDKDSSEAVKILHKTLLRSCGEPSVLVPYRPAEFLTSVYFPRRATTLYCGVFEGLATMLEHKPFVETSLRQFGIPVVEWSYYADEDLPRLISAVEYQPQVLRVNRSSGGKGLMLAKSKTELETIVPSHSDRFIGATAFLTPNIPLNVGGCVFSDGSVKIHTPSIQLIGIGSCTNKMFGYCGNDWGSIKNLETKTLGDLESITLEVGRWLYHIGYVGAFGIDAIVYKGKVFLIEINPRFQGSSDISAELDSRMEIPDIYMDHLAAFLGLPSTENMHVKDLVDEQPGFSQIYSYNRNSPKMSGSDSSINLPADIFLDLVPAKGTIVNPEGILFRLLVHAPVTVDGQSFNNKKIHNQLKAIELKLFGVTPVSDFVEF